MSQGYVQKDEGFCFDENGFIEIQDKPSRQDNSDCNEGGPTQISKRDQDGTIRANILDSNEETTTLGTGVFFNFDDVYMKEMKTKIEVSCKETGKKIHDGEGKRSSRKALRLLRALANARRSQFRYEFSPVDGSYHEHIESTTKEVKTDLLKQIKNLPKSGMFSHAHIKQKM